MANILFDQFAKSVNSVFKDMADLDLKIEGAVQDEMEEMITLGVVSVINFTGKLKGRVVLDMEPGVAIAATQNITSITYNNESNKMVLATIAEMNNIICGIAIAPINNAHGLKLWMSPPYIFAAKEAVMCIPRMSSASLNITTLYGKIRLNIAFEKGES